MLTLRHLRRHGPRVLPAQGLVLPISTTSSSSSASGHARARFRVLPRAPTRTMATSLAAAHGDPRAPTVFVGMSGGVDSSATALLLQRLGFRVEGVFMRNWDGSDEAGASVCPADVDYQSAKSVCETLGIPLRRMDFVAEYWNDVFEPFLDDYERGLTPNPDTNCNRFVKFGAFLQRCLEEGADLVATGHYAQLDPPVPEPFLPPNLPRDQDPFVRAAARPAASFASTSSSLTPPSTVDDTSSFSTSSSSSSSSTSSSSSSTPASSSASSPSFSHSPRRRLLASTDASKDQTYFLCTVPRERFDHVLFPVGGLLKTNVRAVAAAAGLSSASRKDSYGICFVGKRKLKDFLPGYLSLTRGTIVDLETGAVVGEHNGLQLFTRGQNARVGGQEKRLFVAHTDRATGTVTVADAWDHPALFTRSLEVDASAMNWLPRENDAETRAVTAAREAVEGWPCLYRVRHSQRVRGAGRLRLDTARGVWTLHFDKPQRAVSPGQIVALYDATGTECVGGGPIARAGPSVRDAEGIQRMGDRDGDGHATVDAEGRLIVNGWVE